MRSIVGAPDPPDEGISSDDEGDSDGDLLAPVEGLTPVPPTTDSGDKAKTPTTPSESPGGLARLFPKRLYRAASPDPTLLTDSPASTPTSESVTTQDAKVKKRRSRGSKKAGGGEYSFNPENDVLGIVMLEIKGANDLPKLSNSMCVRSYYLSRSLRIACSDEDRLGYGPLRRHLVRQESLPYSRHSTFPQSNLEREAYLPRAPIRV